MTVQEVPEPILNSPFVRRGKISDRIGRLARADVIRLNRALEFCMGLSD